MKKTLAALAVTGLVSLFTVHANATVAQSDCGGCSTPLTGSFAVSIWSANTADATINSPSQQALPTNPIVSSSFLAGSGTYAGDLNFNYDTSWYPTVGGFFNSGNGTYTGSGKDTFFTASDFSRATVIEFSFSIANALTGVTFSHDDGVSLFAAGSTTDLLPTSAAAPTTDANTTLDYLAPGTYNLWYAEVNGLPAVLCVDPTTGGPATVPTVPTPEPASIMLLGAGLATIGLVRRRRIA